MANVPCQTRQGRERRTDERGQAMLEFALTAGLFVVLLIGLVQIALLMHTRLVISHAAEEGVRYAAVYGQAMTTEELAERDARIRNYVLERAASIRTPPLRPEEITIEPAVAPRVSGSTVIVTVRYDASGIASLLSRLMPGVVHIKSASQMRLE